MFTIAQLIKLHLDLFPLLTFKGVFPGLHGGLWRLTAAACGLHDHACGADAAGAAAVSTPPLLSVRPEQYLVTPLSRQQRGEPLPCKQ
jgi:hypothetical protein